MAKKTGEFATSHGTVFNLPTAVLKFQVAESTSFLVKLIDQFMSRLLLHLEYYMKYKELFSGDKGISLV